jgi:2-polyprenyl-6-methoxyphenol hydroxylase-like FAD-dependent oxidoreductase
VRARADYDSVRDLPRLRELFQDFAEPVSGLLAAVERIDRIEYAPIEEVVVEPCAKGRVVLIGDAAHATSPNMAQSAALALEDAVVLGDMLAEMVDCGGSPVDVLAAFAARRRARVRWVHQRTHRRGRIRSLPVFVRNALLRAAGAAVYANDCRPLIDEP